MNHTGMEIADSIIESTEHPSFLKCEILRNALCAKQLEGIASGMGPALNTATPAGIFDGI